MAIGLGQFNGDDDFAPLGEINVTPFIDVILVLLIIFMIAAPISTVDIPVDLPAAVATPQPRPQDPVYVTLKDDLSLAVGETAADRGALGDIIDSITKGERGTRLFIRAGQGVPYGEVIRLFNVLRAAGYLKVALVALQLDDAASGPATAAQ